MSGGDDLQRMIALRTVEPFSRLQDDELLLIARHARPRIFPAGRIVLAAGAVADALFVRVAGQALADGVAAPAVFDAAGLLFGLGARADYVAGADGLEVLVIAKPHVFTIARECPEFVVGLSHLAPGDGAA